MADPRISSSSDELKSDGITTRVSNFNAVGLEINEFELKSIKFEVGGDTRGRMCY